MGSKCSKSIIGWPEIRERLRRTPAAAAGTPTAAAGAGAASQDLAAAGVGAVSRDLAKHGAVTSSNTAQNNPDCAWLEAQEEDSEVGFPVRPQVPLRPMTFKGAFDLSFFLKEKGGLDGLVYSKQRQDILDLWVYNTQGFFPDWQNYTPGPGTRFPLTFGWCFKLVPVDPAEVEEANQDERNSLLHPISQHGMEDSEGDVLVWRFDSSLARRHIARELHPEFYKDC
uniref:Protein Nef n=1 Tax=Human immunodeficiency virus type 1 TaxID=11676 RepID=A0A7L9QQF4_HV1|nr:nef protein [Human immunodeficiency virus 1]QOL05143.1 nef protein [Human immunodeficiency virus 1]QOL05158.1 nef protein [Human immunodeficiency virus 1]QOL05166.1 nef protein [Human immunodeficiency virus 1]QOL05174.1 nef protein [Human immunodeficiency virus 1]